MSKRKSKLEINKFYYIYAGKMHPALIFKIDKNHKTYISIKFGTSKTRHTLKIHPITKSVKEQYVQNKPYEGIKTDYSDKELLGFKIDCRDESILETIKQREPKRTRKARLRYKK